MNDRLDPNPQISDEHHETGSGRARVGARALNEPVLSSAEDELDVNTNTTSQASQAQGSTYTTGDTSPAWWMRLEGQVSRYVNEQPGRAALMAVGAGALAAMLLGRRLSGRRRRD